MMTLKTLILVLIISIIGSSPLQALSANILHLSDPGEALLARAGRSSVLSQAGVSDDSLLMVSGGALRAGGAPRGREVAYAVAMMDAAGVDVVNLAHRDLVGSIEELTTVFEQSSSRFVSASLRHPRQPWTSHVVLSTDEGPVAVVGIAGASPSIVFAGRPISEVQLVEPSEALQQALTAIDENVPVVVLADLDIADALTLRRDFPRITALLVSGRGGIQGDRPAFQDLELCPPGGRRLALLGLRDGVSRFVDLSEPAVVNAAYRAVRQDFGFVVTPLPELSTIRPAAIETALQLPLSGTQVLNLSRQNRAVRCTVHTVALLESIGPVSAAPGRSWLVFDVEFENLLSSQLLHEERLPVSYVVPSVGNHLHLVLDGRRLLPLAPELAIPRQLHADSAIGLSRRGSTERSLLVYEVDQNWQPEHLQLRFYDFAHGHFTLPLTGDGDEPAEPASSWDDQQNEIVTVRLIDHHRSTTVDGRTAPDGSVFIGVDVVARSSMTYEASARAFDPGAGRDETITMGTVTDWQDAHQYTQLLVDGRYAQLPRGEDSTLPAAPRLLPDRLTGGRLVFVVPDDYRSLELRASFPNARLPDGTTIRPRALRWILEGEPPKRRDSTPLWQVQDESLLISIDRRELTADGQLILHLTIRNEGDRAEFFQTREQLRVVDDAGHQAAPLDITFRRHRGPQEHVWIPEGEERSFELVFAVNRQEELQTLVFRGFSREELFALSADGAKPIAASFPPLAIPEIDFDDPQVPQISEEAHDSFADALLLEKPWAARGRLPRHGQAYFRLSVPDHAQLWYVEATGADLQIRDPGDRVRVSRRPNRATGRASIAGLLLTPGDHWFSVASTRAAEYSFRLVPLGEPGAVSEHEPNDDLATANRIEPDSMRVGTIYEVGDRDFYRFSIQEAENLTVQLSAPEDLSLRMDLSRICGARNARRIERVTGHEIAQRVSLQPGDYLISVLPHRSSQRSDHPYVLRLRRENPFGPPQRRLPVNLSLDAMAERPAAFWVDAQRLDFFLHLTNTGDQSVQLNLEAHLTHPSTVVELSSSSLSLDRGASRTIPLSLTLPPDLPADDPIVFTVKAADQEGAAATVQRTIIPASAVPPIDPSRVWPLPNGLLGGYNLAWLALGAEVIGEDRELSSVQTVFDGITPFDGGFNRPPRFPRDFTVRLAGDAAVPVAGVALHPHARGGDSDHYPRDFRVFLSSDGESFDEVYVGQLRPRPEEQAFVFSEPRMARYARLRLENNHGGTGGRTVLGQWKVIGSPGATIPGFGEVNLAAEALGAHVVWADPFPGLRGHLASMLTEDRTARAFQLRAEPRPLEWVLSFYQQRAAQIIRLEWEAAESHRHRDLSEVTVSVSMESPIGPWTEIGTWDLERGSDGIAPLVLSEPVWARYVRFISYDPDEARSSWHKPATLRIFERPTDDEYRSIMAEWGHYSSRAVYEYLEHPKPQRFVPLSDAHATRERSRRLNLDEPTDGSVQVGVTSTWYHLTIPETMNRLALSFRGWPTLRILGRVEDEHGRAVEMQRDDLSASERVLNGEVVPGASYYVKVYEPPRSIVFAWDNSDSMGPYRAALMQGLRTFVSEVLPEVEFANFLPFQSDQPQLLSPEWSDCAHELTTILTNYHGRDDSSDAEPNILAATNVLADRDGARAIMLLTDAETFGYRSSHDMWQALRRAPPQIFSVELHTARNQPLQQNLMQSWAAVNAGHYVQFASQRDIDTAFARAASILRRPASYTLTAMTTYDPPPESVVEPPVAADADAEETRMQKALDDEGRVIAEGILFDINSHTIRSESFPVLRRIGSIMRRDPGLKLRIEGHTDSTGRAAWNQILSERRAASVRQFLIDNYEIEPRRLESVGYGPDRPTASNETAHGRQKNRRVELLRLE